MDCHSQPFSPPPPIGDAFLADMVDPADLPSFTGALYCSSESGCSLYPVEVDAKFSGVYGTGEAVAAAAANSSTGRDLRGNRRLQRTGGSGAAGKGEETIPTLPDAEALRKFSLKRPVDDEIRCSVSVTGWDRLALLFRGLPRSSAIETGAHSPPPRSEPQDPLRVARQ